MSGRIVKAIAKAPEMAARGVITFYRVAISPHFPGCCRFEPTCSEYSLIAFKRFGFRRGLVLTIKRLLKCRPGGPHGYDPVPETYGSAKA